MEAKSFLAAVLVTSVPFFVAAAQHQHEMQSGEKAKPHTMSHMMGKPTFEKALDGYRLQVWVITQEEHKKMVKDTMMGKGMKHDMKGMDHKNMEAMMSGTHHVMVMVEDSTTGKSVEKPEIELTVQFPSKKSTSVTLMEMMGHFGGALTLDEKGEYLVRVHTTISGKMYQAEFIYAVK